MSYIESTAQGADPRDLSEIDLTALVGSRICHDLVSPLGAIGNGVELLTLAGGRGGAEEMELISQSVASANARIRFFRIAFGAAERGKSLGRGEIVSVLADAGRSGKVKVAWRAPGDVSRLDAKLVFLLVQCFESAMPFGGTVEARPERGRWHVTGTAEKLRADPTLWRLLTEGGDPAAVTPAQVHFVLAPDLARRMGRRLRAEIAPGRIEITF